MLMGMEKSRRINSSLGIWVPTDQNAPKLVLTRVKEQLDLVRIFRGCSNQFFEGHCQIGPNPTKFHNCILQELVIIALGNLSQRNMNPSEHPLSSTCQQSCMNKNVSQCCSKPSDQTEPKTLRTLVQSSPTLLTLPLPPSVPSLQWSGFYWGGAGVADAKECIQHSRIVCKVNSCIVCKVNPTRGL